MNIKSYGGTSYTVETKESMIHFGVPSAKFKKEFKVAVTTTTKDGEAVAKKFSDAFVISSPGEYNIASSFIYGVPFDGGTMYSASFVDDITIGYIACKGSAQLDDSVLELLGSIDLLLMYVDGDKGITPDAAEAIVGQVEPSFVVPMYDDAGSKDLQTFFKSLGQEMPTPEKELKIKASQLSDDMLQVALLK